MAGSMGRRPGSKTVTSFEDRVACYDAMVDGKEADECWPWLGTANRHGYGRFFDGAKYRSAAAFGYEAKIGPIPEGHEINHTCASSGCQNPSHWFTDTHAVNMAELRDRNQRNKSAGHTDAHGWVQS